MWWVKSKKKHAFQILLLHLTKVDTLKPVLTKIIKQLTTPTKKFSGQLQSFTVILNGVFSNEPFSLL